MTSTALRLSRAGRAYLAPDVVHHKPHPIPATLVPVPYYSLFITGGLTIFTTFCANHLATSAARCMADLPGPGSHPTHTATLTMAFPAVHGLLVQDGSALTYRLDAFVATAFTRHRAAGSVFSTHCIRFPTPPPPPCRCFAHTLFLRCRALRTVATVQVLPFAVLKVHIPERRIQTPPCAFRCAALRVAAALGMVLKQTSG